MPRRRLKAHLEKVTLHANRVSARFAFFLPLINLCRMKAIALIPLVALVLVISGCNDNPAPGAPAGSNPATAPADYLNNAVKAEKHAFKTIDVTAVKKALESFYVQEGRFPKDLLELVEKSYISRIPELPDGATWDYDTNLGIVKIKSK